MRLPSSRQVNVRRVTRKPLRDASLVATHRRWPRSAVGLIGAPIQVGNVEVSRVRDVLLNKALGQVLGFSVVGRGAYVHFLPWLAADIQPDAVVRSVFTLLSPTELAVYAEHGVALRADGPSADGRPIVDVLVEPEGDVARVVLGARDKLTSPRLRDSAG
jgi:hypothetical protein